MEKIPLSTQQHNKLVQYGKRLFERGNDGSQVYNSLVGFCRDTFGFWMTQDQVTKIFDASLLEYKKSIS